MKEHPASEVILTAVAFVNVLAIVEAVQNSPLPNWNYKYDAPASQVQQTATKLEGAISLHQQKSTQLEQWGKQAQAYQAWSKDPQTIDVKLLAQGLNSPQIHERLATAQKQSQQKQSQLVPGKMWEDRGQDLSQ